MPLKILQINLTILFLACCLLACQKEEQEKASYHVKYHIGCTNCMVVYISDTAGTQITEHQQNSEWTYSFYGQKGQKILLLAYNTSTFHQSVNVKIHVNDSLRKDRTTYCPVNGVSFAVDTLR